MEKHFTVYGKPKGKGRPRFNTRTGSAYTPEGTRKEEKRIKQAFKDQCGYGIFYTTSFLEVEITAYYPVPKSDNKATKEKKLSGQIKPIIKPDIDNVVKMYLDALNHSAWDDDKQVVSIIANKEYSDDERVEVTIREV